MDTRSVYFVVETADEHERLAQQYPGRVLLCDRLFVLDTHDKKAMTYVRYLCESPGCGRWK